MLTVHSIQSIEHFNSQPHKEADNTETGKRTVFQNFNSQPHKEADQSTETSHDQSDISTHSLTRRLTIY